MKQAIQYLLAVLISVVTILAIVSCILVITNADNTNWKNAYYDLQEDYLRNDARWIEDWTEMETAYEFIERMHEMEIAHIVEMYELRLQMANTAIEEQVRQRLEYLEYENNLMDDIEDYWIRYYENVTGQSFSTQDFMDYILQRNPELWQRINEYYN